jgi:hypothetical protein
MAQSLSMGRRLPPLTAAEIDRYRRFRRPGAGKIALGLVAFAPGCKAAGVTSRQPIVPVLVHLSVCRAAASSRQQALLGRQARGWQPAGRRQSKRTTPETQLRGPTDNVLARTFLLDGTSERVAPEMYIVFTASGASILQSKLTIIPLYENQNSP